MPFHNDAASEPDWRTRHCAELAVAAADAASGRDIWRELGGCPRSWKEAAELYRRLGCRSLRDVVTKVLGQPIPVRRAMRGDVVMVRGSLGICRGEVAECMGATVPICEAELAWPARSIRRG